VEERGYDAQHRGTRGSYQRYLAGMDASMRQKVALTAAHLLCRGRVADMGMGSGAGSDALSALYPDLSVVGVDVDPTMVALARERYTRSNLSFVVGDVSGPVFEPGELDGIFDSSVLHHVTSFGGYRYENASRALDVQARELKPHGVLVVRDFVAPEEGEVFLDLPADDGDDSDDPRHCSTAALLERFAGEFRSLSARPGFPCARIDGSPRPGWRRFRLAHRNAVEFLLRKDYRADWEAEAKEEYTYFTQREFEATFEHLGLRILASTPLRNPWIVRNRLIGRMALSDTTGRPLEVPATNFVIVGEKIPADEGVRFREAGETSPLGFLEMTHWRRKDAGEVRDLVRRPHATIDIVPWFEAYEEVFVLARMSYPRPILHASTSGAQSLDGSRSSTYVTEPLNVLQTDKPMGQTVEEALGTLARIEPSAIRQFSPGTTYYPSPGGVQEEVRSVFVEIEPLFVEERIANASSFRTSGRVRALEAEQVLRAAHVGGLPDARIELNVYALLLGRGRGVGPWLGEAIELRDGDQPPGPTTLNELRRRRPRRGWERVGDDSSPGFLELRCTVFEELTAAGAVVARAPIEHVAPCHLSANTVAVAPVRRSGDDVWVGVDDDDLPAAQCFEGNSQILVAPAWRLPREIASLTPARDWVRARLLREYGVECGEVWDLGGRYHPSPGVTSEVVHPMALEVMRETRAPRALHWIRLRDATAHLDDLVDGHLRIVVLRAAHALGLLGG
jgi:SAM-dependent methyltransferase